MTNPAKKINFDFWKDLPKVICEKCQETYRIHNVENFICSNCVEKKNIEKQQEVLKAYQINYLLEHANIPKRYRTSNFKIKSAIQKNVADYYIENFTKNSLDKATDILLFGAIGTGKTYLSCAFAKELIEKKRIEVKYITEYMLLNLYFTKDYQKFEKYKNSAVLILDEIGKRKLIDWQMIQLEELLSHRFNEMLPTIYISNLTDKEFKIFVGERLADRFKESKIKRFAFSGESFR